jgi:hypothetical protein
MGTASLLSERICGREMGMRGMCTQLAARTMWWVGMRKTESVVRYLEDEPNRHQECKRK